MKWYKRDPDAALIGMLELTDAEYRAYGVIIDLLYSRNGDLPDDAQYICRYTGWRPQRWRIARAGLLAKGKIHLLPNGKLTANRVPNEVETYRKLVGNGAKTTSFQRNSSIKSTKIVDTSTTRERKNSSPKGLENSSSLPLAQANGSLARSLPLVALARSPASDRPKKEYTVRKYEFDPTKATLVVDPDGRRTIRNIANPTMTIATKENPVALKIDVNPITGIPTIPGTDQPAWEPKYDSAEGVLDCRPPWERQKDLDHRSSGHKLSSEIIEPGQITWAEVPTNAKVHSLDDRKP